MTFGDGQLKWNAVNAATHYELQIDFLGAPAQQRIVHEQFYFDTSYRIPSTLPKGRYHASIRAIRAEGGQLYAGQWNNVVAFDIG